MGPCGKQRRNLLHASDATGLILKVMEKNLGPMLVNVGYDDDVSIADLVRLICDVADRHLRIVFVQPSPSGGSGNVRTRLA